MRGEFSVFRRNLLNWFREHQRDLPWRNRPSLYKTVISEFMLQQTQVETVLPYFKEWMATFPDFKALAAANEDQVIRKWEGLGYYTRARNLLKLAKSIHDEGIPRKYEDWLERPGIGPYTAAAIASIGQGLPEPVIDGNVIRVLCRLNNDSRPVRSSAEARKRLLPLATELIDLDKPGDYNEALMELGATVCRKNKPACLICPVRASCLAVLAGNEAEIPVIVRRSSMQSSKSRLWLIRDNHILLHFYPASASRLAGLAELPEIQGPKDQKPLLVRKRGISTESITESIYALDSEHPESARCAGMDETKWIPLRQIDTVSLSGPHRRWMNILLRIG